MNGKILLVQSGLVRPSALAIKTIQETAKAIKIEDWKTVTNTIESAMRAVRSSLIEGWNFTDDRLRTYLQLDQHFEFLVAYYFNEQPYLFHIDIYGCTACPENGSYAAIGIGSDLAKYLLKEYQRADPKFEFWDLIAISVIEKVKTNVKDCSGLTWLGVVHSESNIYAKDGWPGYKEGQLYKASVCDAFICRTQLAQSVETELKEQELIALPKKTEQMVETLCAICKKIGLFIYTDSADGGNGFRGSIWYKNEEDQNEILQRRIKELDSRKNASP